MMIVVLSKLLTVALNHQNIGKTLKEYQKLNLLLISIIGTK